MKTAWWIVLLLAAVGINKTTAQYVTIPDSNFVSWLQSNGFSGCMVGDQLDTTCQQVLNAQNITCGPGIANLDGIQYFDSLVSLNCAYNLLTALPQLPDGLSYLDCKNNQLASLPSLPSGLNYLFCSDNQLTQLPTLPGFLNYLDCANNLLTTLPPLPASLEGLDCANNLLTELPPLPVQLGTLIVSDNTGLTCLPPFYIFFGPTPFDFNISNTGIVCLPNYIEHPSYSFYSPIDTMPVCEIVNPNNCEIGWSTFGKTFLDINGDCQQSTEPNLSGIKVILYQDGTAVQQVYTNSFGQHSFNLALDTYTMQIDTANLPFTVSCPANNVHLSYLTASNPLDSTAHFALQCKPGFDLGVIAVVESSGLFFPANSVTVGIHAGDVTSFYGASCNASGVTGTVTALLVGPMTVDSVSNNGLVSGNQITWSVADFSAVDVENDFWLQLTTDTSAQAGDPVCIKVIVSADTGADNNSQNDTLTHCFTVVNSYDPNVKEVYPAKVSQPGDWHTYTIHFQNTGTAAAQNIVVKDTLDVNLDWSSFQLLAYSHENLTQVTQNGIVHFNFPNIQLPDSTSNEPDSHGFVQYRIKTDSTITYGTEIHNTAAIYFDFNEPVITNDALVVYEEPESNSTPFTSANAFTLYPNPANDNVTVQRTSSTKALIQVTDLTGKVLFNLEIEQKQTQLSLEGLTSGAYLIRSIENDRLTGVNKLTVIH